MVTYRGSARHLQYLSCRHDSMRRSDVCACVEGVERGADRATSVRTSPVPFIQAAVSTAVAKVEADQEFLRKAVETAMKRAAATVHGLEFEKAEVPVYLDTLATAAAAAQAESETRATAIAQLTIQVSSAQAQRDELERSLKSSEEARDAATTKVGNYRRLLEETVAKAKVLHVRLQTDAAQAEETLSVAVAKVASVESEVRPKPLSASRWTHRRVV
jgi:chromosome segregation ATPase